jgi:hypothetical protein
MPGVKLGAVVMIYFIQNLEIKYGSYDTHRNNYKAEQNVRKLYICCTKISPDVAQRKQPVRTSDRVKYFGRIGNMARIYIQAVIWGYSFDFRRRKA